MVNPYEIVKKDMLNSSKTSDYKTAYKSFNEFVELQSYPHEFTQCGDETFILYSTDASTFEGTYAILTCIDCIMTNAMIHVNGFRLKDSVISSLRQKYTSKALIIPAQCCNHDLFGQLPTSK